MTNKKCFRCGKSQPKENFYRNKVKKDGLSTWCKSCFFDYRVENIEKSRNKFRRWYSRHTDKARKMCREKVSKNKEKYLSLQRVGQQKYVKNNPKKVLARRLANKYKNDLLLDRCELCGSTDKKYLVMHHTDYDKPLLVITLCTKCHYAIHSNFKYV